MSFGPRAENVGLFYVRNNQGQPVPLSSFTTIERRTGPEFIMHYNQYSCAQINGTAAEGYSSGQATKALEEVFAQTMSSEMGFDYFGMSFQEKKAAEGVKAHCPGILAFNSLRFPNPRRAVRELVAAHERAARHANGNFGSFSGFDFAGLSK